MRCGAGAYRMSWVCFLLRSECFVYRKSGISPNIAAGQGDHDLASDDLTLGRWLQVNRGMYRDEHMNQAKLGQEGGERGYRYAMLGS